jgi:hypothetical protein
MNFGGVLNAHLPSCLILDLRVLMLIEITQKLIQIKRCLVSIQQEKGGLLFVWYDFFTKHYF